MKPRSKVFVVFVSVVVLILGYVLTNQYQAPPGDSLDISPASALTEETPDKSAAPDSVSTRVAKTLNAEQVPTNRNQLNPAFKEVDDDVLNRIIPAVDAKYFKRGNPENYVRHRILEIDTKQFQDQLRQSWISWSDQQIHVPVSIPVFGDVAAALAVRNWIESPFGVNSIDGTVEGVDSPAAYSSFHFSDDGRMNGSINIRGGGYLFALAGEHPYYIVMELEPPGADEVID